MNWTRFLLALAVSGVASSLTDWFFMGLLFHDKYNATPELWRGRPGQPEGGRILISTLVGVLSCAALLYLCVLTGSLTAKSSLTLAALVWVAGPLAVIRSNIAWMRMHPLLGLSHSLGWLARFVITALVAVWLL